MSYIDNLYNVYVYVLFIRCTFSSITMITYLKSRINLNVYYEILIKLKQELCLLHCICFNSVILYKVLFHCTITKMFVILRWLQKCIHLCTYYIQWTKSKDVFSFLNVLMNKNIYWLPFFCLLIDFSVAIELKDEQMHTFVSNKSWHNAANNCTVVLIFSLLNKHKVQALGRCKHMKQCFSLYAPLNEQNVL